MDSGVRRVRRPTISVVCPTAHPGQVIAAALGDLREVVDEVVVAADARVGADDLGHYAQVADTLLRFEFAGSNRHWPWLAEQARGDWLLIHDGDELVSSALLDALGDLVSDRRIHQYSLPIHWPWPDSTRRLVGEPWDSGHGLRLVRNDGRLAFYAAKHAIAVADNPIRHMDELPVYHLDLLFADRTSREAKVARYDAELFGLMTAEGLPVNAAYYVPESAEEPPATIHIPREDSDRIEHAIRALGSVPAVDPKAIALHDREQIQWYAPRAVLQPEDYRGTIELARALPVFVAQYDQHPVWVRITNGGNARWPGGEGREPNIRVGAYWRALDGSARQEAGRALLTHVLDPGETTLVPAAFPAPPHAGPFELVIDLVHEHVRWFDCALTVRVDVQPSAGERLDSLAARYGPLIPVAALVQVRRAIARPNGLLRHVSTDRRFAELPRSPHPKTPRRKFLRTAAAVTRTRHVQLDELMRDLPVGGWAIDTATVDRIAQLVREVAPRAVVEFGSGTSTVVLAALLRELHVDGWPRVVSFAQDPSWLNSTRAALTERGLTEVAEVMCMSLGPTGNNTPPCYLLDDAAASFLQQHPPELILVDGPPLHPGASRLGTVDLVTPFLQRDATLLLDHALHDAELCVAEAWQRRPDVVVHGIRPTPTGLLEATLSPS